jgi:methanogenic corrinoid protein MtbC1
LNSQHALSRTAHAFGSAGSGAPGLKPADAQSLAELSLQPQSDLLAAVQLWQQRGLTLPQIYLDGITQAARVLGQWWLSDDIDFATVTVGSSRLHQLLYELSPSFQADAALPIGATTLLLAEPESQHTMGLFMLSEFFKRAGWYTLVHQPRMDLDLQRLLSGHWVDVLALSVSTHRQMSALRSLIAQARALTPNPRMAIIAGGPMALSDPQSLIDLGADWIGTDAMETVERATLQLDPQTLQN